MTKFHKNFNIMSMFTAVLLAIILFFWRTFLNIAVANVVLNGIIIGTSIFGIVICFIQMFHLLPEYRWLHAYFSGVATSGFVPKILRPIAMALNNRHTHITTASLNELLELISSRIESERDSVRYVTNTLIFLGLLGTFWGLILTIGGFADLLISLDFESEAVLQNMQNGMSIPLTGMATAFTSSLLGLAGSLSVGFLGQQVQFAQNTMFQDLTDFMTKYTLQEPTATPQSIELAAKAPVTEAVYGKINDIYDIFAKTGYKIYDLIRIDGKHPAVIALGTDEKLFIGTTGIDNETLEKILKRIELCFADTLEGISIDTRILSVDGADSNDDGKIIHFASIDDLNKYMSAHKNIRPKNKTDIEDFESYADYVTAAMEYLFKPQQ
ncbi:MAG: hypothetical protein J6S57_02185 [Alphaproteobacteria bacterium]|nr:hypothetical protein [Alphaproteobacteria bacterium]